MYFTAGQGASSKVVVELLRRSGSNDNKSEDSKTINSEMEVRSRSTEGQLNQSKNHSAVSEVRLRVSERQSEEQKKEDSDVSKVAFSAGSADSGIVGPFDEETTLIFSKTITNIGRGYNSSAGVFTAPVRGLYFFSFTVADYLKGYMGVYSYRNEQPIIFSSDLNDHGGYASITSAVASESDEGDRISLASPASYRLYDDSRNFSVFSGFSLFPV